MQEIDLIASILNKLTENETKDNAKKVQDQYDTLKSLMTGPNSISRRSKMSIFEYPTIISGSFGNTEIIAGILKTLEVEYARMLLLLFGINPSANFNQNLEIQQTLSNYHMNSSDYKFSYARENANFFPNESIEEAYKNACKHGVQLEAKGDVNVPDTAGPKTPKDSKGSTRSYADKDNNNGKNPKEEPIMKEVDIMGKYSSLYNFTVLEVNLLTSAKEKPIKFPIGIRAAPHILPTNHVEYIISSFLKPQTSNSIVNYFRWRSGEISFVELITRYSEIKQDINFDKLTGTDKSWLKTLKQRANNRRVTSIAKIFTSNLDNGKTLKTNDIPPNLTYILSFENINQIEEETGVNLFTSPKSAAKFLDDSMALSMVIIDEATKVVHILHSGYTKYASYPLSSVLSKSLKEKDMTKLLVDFMKQTM